MADSKEQVEMPDYLSMSDDEIRNMTAPVAAPALEEEELEEQPAGEVVEPADESKETDEAEDKDDDKETDEAEDADDEAGDSQAEKEAPEGDKETKEATEKVAKPAAKEEAKPSDEQAVDYEAEYKRLLAPFKANGRDIQVKNADEAITLMQMGANYNKKMALKPNLKLMKLLENSGLLSEEKIGFLIDLNRKDPAAINKLVKDSGIDPMDLDAEKASAYRQTTYTVDDREIELDTVLDEIQHTTAYNRTLDVVSNKWDAASKQTIAGSPQLLKVINDHIANGVYDLISKEVENERVFGRLNGLSDIEAYRRIGDSLHARGAFNHLSQGSSQPQGKPAPAVVVTPKPKPEEEDKRKDKKRAASSTKPVVSASASEDFNPLSMSDDEFSKLVNKRLM